MQTWHRWRQPVAVVLLVALVLTGVLRAVTVAWALDQGQGGALYGVLPGGDDLLLLLAAAAAVWCATPMVAGPGAEPAPSRHARAVVLAAAAVVGLTVLGWLVLAVWSAVTVLGSPAPDGVYLVLALEGLLRLVPPVLAVAAVGLALRRTAAVGSAAAPPAPETAVISAPSPVSPASPARLPAAWQVDQAAGAVWLSADDAAQGRPALDWSTTAGVLGSGAAGAGEGDGGWPDRPTPGAAESPVPPAAPPREPGPGPRPGLEDDDLR